MTGLDNFSPLGRRLIALGLLAVLLLGGVTLVMMPLGAWMAESSANLADLRFRRDQLDAIAARPAPPPAPTALEAQLIAAPSSDAALARLQADLQSAATTAGIEFQLTPAPSAADASLVAVVVNASAPEEKLLQFLSQVEQAQPLVRFRSWRLGSPQPGESKVAFSGEAVAAWGRR